MKNSKLVTLKEIKQIQLEELTYLHEFCVENGLTYYLAYGTLIGAVRHKGYIPWDDDIDVWMPRSDYDKLIELTERFNNEDLELLSYEKEKKYCFEWAKVCSKKTIVWPSRFNNGFLYGISIDVFPLNEIDYKGSLENAITVNESDHKKLIDMMNGYKLYTDGNKSNLLKSILKKVRFKLLELKKGRLQDKLLDFFDKNDFKMKDGKYYQTFLCSERKVYKREWFKDPIELEFEGRKFFAPKNYDKILTLVYGDYMKLPPKEKRITNHNFTAYYKK